jgi:hypothetical protein
VLYNQDEVPQIKEWLAENYDRKIKSVSFLLKKDHGFPLPPLEEVTEGVYRAMLSKVKDVKIGMAQGSTDLGLECEGGVCPVK